MSIQKKEIHHFVLTGGPCAGKSTALVHTSEKLSQIGYRVFTVPEAASTCITSGISPASVGLYEFQKHVMDLSLTLEESAIRAAHTVPEPRVVILHDRGIMDGQAYVSSADFSRLLKEYRLTIPDARDLRYDAVFHLRTAALGAEAYYTLANNAARNETPEQARVIDECTLAAWVGHPHLRVIDNERSFDEKMNKLFHEICAALGVPIPLEIEKRFLVQPVDIRKHLRVYQTVDIEQMYLIHSDPQESLRVRKRGQGGDFVYYRALKRAVDREIRTEQEHRIDAREYAWSAQFMQSGTRPIQKRRTCFVHQSQYFEYDVFHVPEGLHILEIELTDKNDRLIIPDYVDVIREVTGDPAYHNMNLARVAP